MRVFVIYRASNGRLTRWVTTEGDCAEVVRDDEAMIEMPATDYVPGVDMQAWLTAAVGKDPGSDDRYALVDNATGEVVREVYDEPENPSFTKAGHVLVKHAEAGPGWKYSAGKMEPPASKGEVEVSEHGGM